MKENRRTRRPHRDWAVWQLAMKIISEVYRVTESLPEKEKFGLQSQMRRAAVSVASNIAKGAARGSSRALRHFLIQARGSLSELETQLEICINLHLLNEADLEVAFDLTDNLSPALQAFINTITRRLDSQ